MFLLSKLTKFLHYLPSELSHTLALEGLKILHKSGILNFIVSHTNSNKKNVDKDLRYLSNKVGLAAGLDKNGDYIDCLAALGIDFIELGTVTPRPQKGNPKPRIFRNLKEKSIINRLGFNNKGVDHLAERLKCRKSNVIVGSSIGKNFDTPNEEAYKDYIFCLERIYQYSDYIAVNISSPNTEGLRNLGHPAYLDSLLKKIKTKQTELSATNGYKPIFIKISPDENRDNIKIICDHILINKIDGIICSNTSIHHEDENGPGGLSGSPLKDLSTLKLKEVREIVGPDFPIVACGGVMSANDFQEKVSAGANSVQIYTGFIFEGPKLVLDIVKIIS